MTMQTTASSVYDAAQFEDNFPVGIQGHYWFLARNGVLDRTLKAAERHGHLPPSASILEVGCGTGVVVAGLLARGYDISGVELGQPRWTTVPDRIRLGTRAQDLDLESRAKVDALMLLDVIEHVPDDVSFLRDTLAAFPNCRAVFITVPARPELWSDHDRRYGHYRRYTRRSLSRNIEAAGLAIAESRYVFRSLYAAAALIKMSGRQRQPVMAAPANKPLHRALAAVLAAEDRLFSAIPVPGLSIVATAIRPKRDGERGAVAPR